MSNGFSTYASYTDLSSINEVEENQVVQNLTVTGKLTLTNPLEVSSGGTEGVTEEGARASLNVYSKDEIHNLPNFNYVAEEVVVGSYFGKTLYRQYFSGKPTAAATSVNIGTINNFDKLAYVEGSICSETSGIWISYPYGRAATGYADARVLTDGTVQLYVSTTDAVYHLFFYYTKTV